MKKQKIIQESIDIITAYYNNELEPFFSSIADDVLWIGPRSGQELQGKENIIRAWTSAENPLTFTMGNIEAKSVQVGSAALEVLLEYFVYTHFPNGETDRHHQRLHYSWGSQMADGKKVPRICMIHISNISEQDEAYSGDGVKLYASSLDESRIDSARLPEFTGIYFRTVTARSSHEITWYFNSATVLYVESTDRSLHSRIHTTEGTFDAIEKLRYFEQQFGKALVRVHASYLINPLFLRSIERFEATLTDGTRIPIPEKKYTFYKNNLLRWNGGKAD